MAVNSPMNIRHNNWGVKTGPFNEIYNVYTTAKIVFFLTSNTLNFCFNFVFLFHSFLVLTIAQIKMFFRKFDFYEITKFIKYAPCHKSDAH